MTIQSLLINLFIFIFAMEAFSYQQKMESEKIEEKINGLEEQIHILEKMSEKQNDELIKLNNARELENAKLKKTNDLLDTFSSKVINFSGYSLAFMTLLITLLNFISFFLVNDKVFSTINPAIGPLAVT